MALPEGSERASAASDRRTFLTRSLGVAAGVTGTVVTAAAFAAPASATSTGSNRIQSTQDAWRFCTKCYTLYYWGYPTDGVCPAGGAHSAQGFNFILPYDVPETPNQQRNWRFCTKCFSMYFWGYPTDGVCPAGGAHTAQGFNFCLPHDISETSTRQANWRFCTKCFVMFYYGYPTNGRCAAGNAHSAQGYNFVLSHY
ncbi:hypothetical protein [Streptomyces sp. NPDC090025]|uniref:hypothetical protein n=1 Tax=Streptomyces sp. NPDC090025 TaxID=3365922 RepID=UPI0038330AED